MDIGPQKESDTTRSKETKKRRGGRKSAKGKKRHFKARPERQVGNYINIGRKKIMFHIHRVCLK